MSLRGAPLPARIRGTMARSVARRLIGGRNQCAQHSRFPSSLFFCVCVPLARNFYVRVSILFFRGTIFQRLIFLLAAPFCVRFFVCLAMCLCFTFWLGWACSPGQRSPHFSLTTGAAGLELHVMFRNQLKLFKQ